MKGQNYKKKEKKKQKTKNKNKKNSQFHYRKCIDCDETIRGIPLRNFELSSIPSIL